MDLINISSSNAHKTLYNARPLSEIYSLTQLAVLTCKYQNNDLENVNNNFKQDIWTWTLQRTSTPLPDATTTITEDMSLSYHNWSLYLKKVPDIGNFKVRGLKNPSPDLISGVLVLEDKEDAEEREVYVPNLLLNERLTVESYAERIQLRNRKITEMLKPLMEKGLRLMHIKYPDKRCIKDV